MITRILAAMLILLLLTVDFSLESHLAFNRSAAWWTPWYYKLGPFSVADLILIAVTIYATVRALAATGVRRIESRYLALSGVAAVYLVIGLAYNLFIYPLWKTYLYDVKVVLYLTVPYLFLRFAAKDDIRRWFTPTRIFTFGALASILDYCIVNRWGTVEYQHYLGFSPILELVPIQVSVVAALYASKPILRMAFIVLAILEVVSSVNRLALGSLFLAASALPFLLLLHIKISRAARFAGILAAIAVVNVVSVILLGNPLHYPLLEAKADGVVTRQIQFQNVLLAFDQNIPGFIGKGLGSTWFEYIRLPSNDFYAVGTSVADTPEAALVRPVKFIFNFVPASLLYKWGIVGTVLLAFFLARFYSGSRAKLDLLAKTSTRSSGVRTKQGVLLISFLFAVQNFTYIGLAKSSLITSLLAFYVEHSFATMATTPDAASAPEQGPPSARLATTRPYGSEHRRNIGKVHGTREVRAGAAFCHCDLQRTPRTTPRQQ